MAPIITLTTDFGLQDHYVGVLKAVILKIAPDARLIDISHLIPPQDIMAGAWVTRNAFSYFPKGTIHLVVVDPGVGSGRRPILLECNGHYFVGPDNGIFSLIENAEEAKPYELSNPEYWLQTVSVTFHGRDIFAPVAAHLANGVPPREFGPALESIEHYRWPEPIADKDGIQGWIIHIDVYGNLISNISEEMFQKNIEGDTVKIYVGNTILKHQHLTFSDVEAGDPVVFFGSSGMLEVAINKGNAKEALGVEKGAPISVVPKP